ncbi:MAG TPA: hypothetical protein VN258_18460 [Mobilitalea sp.]|nr:hypothetical protein [Mobilitalea sp.]
MTRLALCICTALILIHPKEDLLKATYGYITNHLIYVNAKGSISNMEALDMVKEQYAANFEKVYRTNTKDEYYYKLPEADYYLAYEGQGRTTDEYLFHLYEFVLDEPDSGVGHAVTYGWYTVNRITGVITDQTQ